MKTFNVDKTLLALMAIPASFTLASIVKTADGFYIGQKEGDIGYNCFIGKPRPPHAGPGRDLILGRWNELMQNERALVVQRAAHPIDGVPIDLAREFGIPV